MIEILLNRVTDETERPVATEYAPVGVETLDGNRLVYRTTLCPSDERGDGLGR